MCPRHARHSDELPQDVVPIGLALIGKPAADPLAERGTSRLKERRRELDDVVRWERWDQAPRSETGG